jgi:hypothetical protein
MKLAYALEKPYIVCVQNLICMFIWKNDSVRKTTRGRRRVILEAFGDRILLDILI